MQIINKNINSIKTAIFDFDGTVSTLREGWEEIMQPLMLSLISPDKEPSKELIKEVQSYIDESTGIQTVFQMQWLSKRVEQSTGILLDEWWYKDQYNDHLLQMVEKRIDKIKTGKKEAEDFRIAGSLEFFKQLHSKGIKVYIASGTDDIDLQKEIEILGIAPYIEKACGAPHREASCPKEKVISDLLNDPELLANEIVVIGDGKVEIMLAKESGALAIGTATDEKQRKGINQQKQQKLIKAGADCITGDFLELDGLLSYLNI